LLGTTRRKEEVYRSESGNRGEMVRTSGGRHTRAPRSENDASLGVTPERSPGTAFCVVMRPSGITISFFGNVLGAGGKRITEKKEGEAFFFLSVGEAQKNTFLVE